MPRLIPHTPRGQIMAIIGASVIVYGAVNYVGVTPDQAKVGAARMLPIITIAQLGWLMIGVGGLAVLTSWATGTTVKRLAFSVLEGFCVVWGLALLVTTIAGGAEWHTAATAVSWLMPACVLEIASRIPPNACQHARPSRGLGE